mmetsp:Transcript_12077/g.25729  ORF Transcript_12077/g.25729 Transcript_12077/m.25729 type:complete len:82 (+) Transcript_12077:2253-2498(+)
MLNIPSDISMAFLIYELLRSRSIFDIFQEQELSTTRTEAGCVAGLSVIGGPRREPPRARGWYRIQNGNDYSTADQDSIRVE